MNGYGISLLNRADAPTATGAAAKSGSGRRYQMTQASRCVQTVQIHNLNAGSAEGRSEPSLAIFFPFSSSIAVDFQSLSEVASRPTQTCVASGDPLSPETYSFTERTPIS